MDPEGALREHKGDTGNRHGRGVTLDTLCGELSPVGCKAVWTRIRLSGGRGTQGAQCMGKRQSHGKIAAHACDSTIPTCASSARVRSSR